MVYVETTCTGRRRGDRGKEKEEAFKMLLYNYCIIVKKKGKRKKVARERKEEEKKSSKQKEKPDGSREKYRNIEK